MADAVELAFRRAARRLISGRPRVLLAVSGGGDSVAMLHLAARLSAAHRPEIVVAHLDHGLRRGSAADARFVAELAASLELPLIAARRDVRAERRRDESLEESARRVRRAFLLEAAREAGASLIATGHTLDDQAETIVMRLARGAGPSSVAGMLPAGPGPFVKPLLAIERAALRAWLARRRLRFREDPSNASPSFDRNRVRRLVMPLLAKTLNPAAARHVVETAARLREDATLLDEMARAKLDEIAKRRADALVLPAASLAGLPRPLAARVVRLVLEASGCDPRRLSSRQVDAVLALASRASGGSLDLPGRLAARRRGRLIEFARCASPARS
jgi:tRNA(Ile)-lysidine synthase